MSEPLIVVEGNLRLPTLRPLVDPILNFGREWLPALPRPVRTRSEFAIAAARLETEYVGALHSSDADSPYRATSFWGIFAEADSPVMLDLMQGAHAAGMNASLRAAPIQLTVDAPVPPGAVSPTRKRHISKPVATAIAAACAAFVAWLLFADHGSSGGEQPATASDADIKTQPDVNASASEPAVAKSAGKAAEKAEENAAAKAAAQPAEKLAAKPIPLSVAPVVDKPPRAQPPAAAPATPTPNYAPAPSPTVAKAAPNTQTHAPARTNADTAATKATPVARAASKPRATPAATATATQAPPKVKSADTRGNAAATTSAKRRKTAKKHAAQTEPVRKKSATRKHAATRTVETVRYEEPIVRSSPVSTPHRKKSATADFPAETERYAASAAIARRTRAAMNRDIESAPQRPVSSMSPEALYSVLQHSPTLDNNATDRSKDAR